MLPLSISIANERPDPTGLREIVADDMRAVDDTIRDRLHSEVALVNQLGNYIIASGGKRLRPMVAILSARAHGYTGDEHIQLAAIVEFIHTATLLHDDVVDASYMRRGRQTANLVWGNQASVLVGDYLYSRAFQMMVELRNMRVMEILAAATNTIAEGEVLQITTCHDPNTTEQRYLEVIRSKTAKLFEAALQVGPVISEGSAEQEENMAAYGRHLGTAFQLIDDALDYSADAEELGKNIGDDLAEGKPTLPLLYTMWHGSQAQSDLIREAIEQGGLDRLDEVLAAIESTGAIAYTARLAENESRLALAALAKVPPSPYRTALVELAEFAVRRRS